MLIVIITFHYSSPFFSSDDRVDHGLWRKLQVNKGTITTEKNPTPMNINYLIITTDARKRGNRIIIKSNR